MAKYRTTSFRIIMTIIGIIMLSCLCKAKSKEPSSDEGTDSSAPEPSLVLPTSSVRQSQSSYEPALLTVVTPTYDETGSQPQSDRSPESQKNIVSVSHSVSVVSVKVSASEKTSDNESEEKYSLSEEEDTVSTTTTESMHDNTTSILSTTETTPLPEDIRRTREVTLTSSSELRVTSTTARTTTASTTTARTSSSLIDLVKMLPEVENEVKNAAEETLEPKLKGSSSPLSNEQEKAEKLDMFNEASAVSTLTEKSQEVVVDEEGEKFAPASWQSLSTEQTLWQKADEEEDESRVSMTTVKLSSSSMISTKEIESTTRKLSSMSTDSIDEEVDLLFSEFNVSQHYHEISPESLNEHDDDVEEAMRTMPGGLDMEQIISRRRSLDLDPLDGSQAKEDHVDNKKQDPLSRSTVIGLVIGAAVMLVTGAGVIAFLIYREKKRMNKPRSLEELYANSDTCISDDLSTRRISHIESLSVELRPSHDRHDDFGNLDNDSFLNSLEVLTFPGQTWPHYKDHESDV